MELLKNKILNDGHALGKDILKVDSFLNHQLDIRLFEAMGEEFARRFENVEVTKILTIETSGIAIAAVAAKYFDYCPVVFGKKNASLNLDKDIYTSEVYSFTKQQTYQIMVSKKYLNPEDKVLIIDDFLANGKAVSALEEIVKQSGAQLMGVGIAIEKGFQNGGKEIRESGIRLESLAIVDEMHEDGTIIFRD